jgi:hypothetical protein
VHWLGLQINMQKSYISAIDFSTDQLVATDSITLNEIPSQIYRLTHRINIWA